LSAKKVVAPEFEIAFFLPKYWLTWLSVLILYSLSWLPYKLQKSIGKLLGKLLKVIAKKRYNVAKRNLELSFPELSQAKRQKILDANLDNAGMAILETGMGWWWPTWRVTRKAEFEGFEHIEAILAKGKGVLAYAIHNMNLEFACRIAGLKYPSVVFYRKHNNRLMEYINTLAAGVVTNIWCTNEMLEV
jgi:KDO2-lipid IV(A) lauroyltransferase